MLVDRTPGLYVHVPFCSAICPYCDFSVLTGGAAQQRRYVDLLLLEAERVAPGAWEPFGTLYLGGGTPSALSSGELSRLLAGLAERLPLRPDLHLSMEANPEDVTAESLAAWRALDVDMLSLGVQSFDDRRLGWLGRRHDARQASDAVGLAAASGFTTLSIDLIFGLPGQSAEAWAEELETALATGIDHLSCYQLTIHQGTPFGFRHARGDLAELPEDQQAELYRHARRRLAGAGWQGYEVSSFAAAPRHRSRHNPKYWHHVPYLGLGPSAHSFDGERRWWNLRKLGRWAERIAAGEDPVEEVETLTRRDLVVESLMLGLRTREGVSLARLAALGCDLLGSHAETVERLAATGLWRLEGDALFPTDAGLAVADGLARTLVGELADDG